MQSTGPKGLHVTWHFGTFLTGLPRSLPSTLAPLSAELWSRNWCPRCSSEMNEWYDLDYIWELSELFGLVFLEVRRFTVVGWSLPKQFGYTRQQWRRTFFDFSELSVASACRQNVRPVALLAVRRHKRRSRVFLAWGRVIGYTLRFTFLNFPASRNPAVFSWGTGRVVLGWLLDGVSHSISNETRSVSGPLPRLAFTK